MQRLMWKRRLANTSIGGLTDDEVREEAQKDIQTLVAQLSKTNFIASDSLADHDFTVAAHIASILYSRLGQPVGTAIQGSITSFMTTRPRGWQRLLEVLITKFHARRR